MKKLISYICQGNRRFYFKMILIGFLIFLMLFNSLTSFTVTSASEEPKCLQDKLINNTNFFYNFFKKNSNFRKIISVGTFWILDLSILITSVNWVWKGKNSRPILNLFLFFLLRTILNFSFHLKIQDTLIQDNSDMYSIFVSNNMSKNSFFSAIIGVYVICALELYDNKFKKLSFLTLLGMISYFFLTLTTRSEYFISLFCGITSAHYFHIISNKYHHIFDNLYILSMQQPLPKDQELKSTHLKSKEEKSEVYHRV